MPRSFDLGTDYATSVERVHRALSDRQYWLARLAESGADATALDRMDLGTDGSVDVTTTHVLRRDRLPGVVSQFHRGDLVIRREETWTPVTDSHARAAVTGSIADAPVLLTGDVVLGPRNDLSRLDFRGTVEVRVPLVGRKLENFIGNQLTELLIAEQRFTTAWIAENH